jgi:hypothetical protein
MADLKSFSTADPEPPLAELCRILRVPVETLMAAGGDEEFDRRTYNLQEYLNVLFNADNSVQDVMRLILEAAKFPCWYVCGYFRDDHDVLHELGCHAVRAPNDGIAAWAAWCELWDERLTSAGCTWAYEATKLDDHEVDAHQIMKPQGQIEGEVRIDR